MRYTAGGGEGESVGNIGCGQRRCGGKHGTAGGENPVGTQEAARILVQFTAFLRAGFRILGGAADGIVIFRCCLVRQ